ncbi:MAG: hypothetical protein K5707_06345 [Clostridia bacterium]|nr:hypothetical protein [Clostridia bacterium]
MRKIIRKSHLLIALLALLVLTVSIGSAYAYFTTYVKAKGGYTLNLGTVTRTSEEFKNWKKSVTITNDKDSAPVFIRARAYSGSKYPLTYSADEKWTPGADGFYYYSDPVPAEGSTTPLVVTINNVPEKAEPGEEFNVVVIYESTPVNDEESGKAYADCSSIQDNGKMDSVTSEFGGADSGEADTEDAEGGDA